MTPLQYCVENKNGIGCVNPLIKAKANVNAVNKGGVQLLHAAAQLGDAPVVKVLLEAGAERRLLVLWLHTALLRGDEGPWQMHGALACCGRKPMQSNQRRLYSSARLVRARPF